MRSFSAYRSRCNYIYHKYFRRFSKCKCNAFPSIMALALSLPIFLFRLAESVCVQVFSFAEIRLILRLFSLSSYAKHVRKWAKKIDFCAGLQQRRQRLSSSSSSFTSFNYYQQFDRFGYCDVMVACGNGNTRARGCGSERAGGCRLCAVGVFLFAFRFVVLFSLRFFFCLFVCLLVRAGE